MTSNSWKCLSAPALGWWFNRAAQWGYLYCPEPDSRYFISHFSAKCKNIHNGEMKECVTKLYSSSHTKPIANKKKIEFSQSIDQINIRWLLLSRHSWRWIERRPTSFSQTFQLTLGIYQHLFILPDRMMLMALSHDFAWMFERVFQRHLVGTETFLGDFK